MVFKSCCLSLLVLLFWTLVAVAQPITYISTGTGSGTIGGTPFADRAFVFTAHADTDDVESFPPDFWAIDHLNTHIAIDGVGEYTITSPLRTFLNLGVMVTGLGRAGGSDLYNLAGDFTGWDLVSNWGPINATGWLLQWDVGNINTDGGVLVFNNQSEIPATFQAILGQGPAPTPIPTLSEWGMIIFSVLLAGSAIWMMRRRQVS
jgi:hypothetical protein